MAEIKKRKATYDDLLALPEHLVGEIIDGDLIVTPRPALPHAAAASAIGGALHGPFSRNSGGGSGAPGGWWILFEPELHFDHDVLVPDLAGWRRERMPVVPNAPAVELAPDWICEVVSPSTARLDRTRKLRVYARIDIPHVWIVDPLARTLEVFQLKDGSWLLQATHAGDEKIHADPFAAIEVDLARWWVDSV